jgi:hypothetical protein
MEIKWNRAFNNEEEKVNKGQPLFICQIIKSALN